MDLVRRMTIRRIGEWFRDTLWLRAQEAGILLAVSIDSFQVSAGTTFKVSKRI